MIYKGTPFTVYPFRTVEWPPAAASKTPATALHKPNLVTAFFPAKLEPKKIKPAAPRYIIPTKPQEPSLVRSSLQSEFAQASPKLFHKPLSILLMLKNTDKVIRKADEQRAALTNRLGLFLKPQIQDIMQVEVGQDRRHDPTLRCARCRMNHRSVRVQDTCLEPFFNQAQKRLSSIRSFSIRSIQSWSMLSKNPLMSASTTQQYFPYCSSSVRALTASRGLRPGRYP